MYEKWDDVTTTVAHLIESCAIQRITLQEMLLRPDEAASLPMVFPGEQLEFTGLAGERYAATVRRFNAMVATRMATPRSTYLPHVRWLARAVYAGRNILVELTQRVHYEYLAERRLRFGEAVLAYTDRAFRVFMSPASPLRTLKRIRSPSCIIAQAACDAGVPIEYAHSAYEGARAWLKVQAKSRKPKKMSRVKESLARAAIGHR